MSEEFDELPPDVRAFLEPERSIVEPPSASLARMHARLRDAIDAPVSIPSRGTGGVRARDVATLGAGVLIGVVLGIVGTLLWRPPPVMQPLPVNRAELVSAPLPVGVVGVDARMESELSPLADDNEHEAARERARPRPRETRSNSHAFERQMLDAARSAITRGHPAEGLTVLERHRHEHPQGVLSEERDALRVRALLELDRIDAAEREAERFFEVYPESLFRSGLTVRLERARGR